MKFPSPIRLIEDIKNCLGFYTRLHVPLSQHTTSSFADAQWAAPVAGIIIGFFTSAILWLALAIGLPVTLAVIISLAASILLTGALHEDGLADVADGFGGGHDRARKLEIMRDSRLVSYGALVLVVSFFLKYASLSLLAAQSSNQAFYALIAAHCASRAILPAFVAAVPPARKDGLSANLGQISSQTVGFSVLIGLSVLISGGVMFAGYSIIILAFLFLFFKGWATRHIGGQTGDVLGALQQSSEIIILIIAATIFSSAI